MRGEQSVWLRRDAHPIKGRATKDKSKGRRSQKLTDQSEESLWQALKAKRLELAREQSVPSYVIFHDSTLLEILKRRPSLVQFGQRSGVGQAKLARYAEAFLKVVEDDANVDC